MSTAIYDKTAGDLLRDALRDASIVGVGIPINGEDWTIASSALNDVLSFWQAKAQINLWRETQALLPLNPNQSDYFLGPNGDHCFTDYVYSVSNASAIAGATGIFINNGAVIAAAGYTTGDFVGVELDTGFRHWTTIAGLAGGVIALTTPIPTASRAGSSIYVYRTKIDRPIRILDAQTSINRGTYDTPVKQISRKEYYNLSNRNDFTGNVNQWYYSPQLNNGQLSVWPASDGKASTLIFTFVKPQYIPEDQSENILIPSEFYLALKWAVASELAVTYAVSSDRLVAIESKARAALEDALSNDVENDYFSVQPE